MDIEKRVNEWIEKNGMPERKEGHLSEIIKNMKTQKDDVETFGCSMQQGCLVCCVTQNGDEYCWIEWCHA